MAQWWELNSDRWQREQEALATAGISFQVDKGAQSKGRLALNLTMQWNDQPLRLVAHFPFNYPYAHPMVVAPTLDLARHQTPGTKQLCLLRQNGKDWQPASDTLASLILDQLPHVFAGQPGEPEEDNNGKEAEPMTAFLQTEQGSFIGFPSYELSGLTDNGTFTLGLTSIRPLRGTVIEVLDEHGKVIVTSETRTRDHFNNRPVITGRWVKLPKRPEVRDAKHYYQLAADNVASCALPNWQALPNNSTRVDILALLFPDELTWNGSEGNAIVVSKVIAKQAKAIGSIDTRLHRVELESRSIYFQRDPSATGLKNGCVSLIGTGSIGSPAAKLLAQGGIGELRLFDHDVLDAGNAIRWELGRDYAGHHKVAVLQGVLGENFPYTKVLGTLLRIGEARFDDLPGLAEAYDRLFRDVTCVFDASASTGVNNYLSSTARQRGIPYVWMYATPGAWGGLVGRASPNTSEFCWMCHLYYLTDQSAALKIPALRSAPEDEEVQPAGCLDPTFVGAQVDLTEVSLMGARLVIDEVLTQNGTREASHYDWNVAVLELCDEEGRPQLPKWTPFKLPRHVKCPNH